MSKQLAQAGRNPALWALAGAAALAVALVAVMTALSGSGYAAPAQAQYAPNNTAPPTISGTAQEGQTLTANTGTWTGDQPMVFTFQWVRCNTAGANCVAIPQATQQTYAVTAADVGNTIRVTVTGRNNDGSSSATSAQTAVVTKASTTPPPASGTKSVSAVTPPDRLIVDRVEFNPNPVRDRTAPVTVRVKVTDTNGTAISGAVVFVRSTPVVTNTPPEAATGADGWVTFTVQPQVDFPIKRGYSVQFFVRARKSGDNPLAGISGRRLVQVSTAR
jgi:hypothetical protein